MERVKSFLLESKSELNRINWPTTAETTRLTLIVVFFSLITAAYLGLIDTVLIYLLNMLVLNTA